MDLFDFCGRRLSRLQPQVMGILNLTPDSFSDGGELFQGATVSVDALLRRAESMLEDGASILDIGGESTRPGAAPVSEQQELDRVIPALQQLRAHFDVVISVDTSTPAVMREAASNGASLINDVRALQREGALAAAADTGLPVCLMHMQGEPQTMQQQPGYTDVIEDVMVFLTQRVESCEQAGIDRAHLILDPGFGFGKTLAHNYQLLNGFDRLAALGLPLLAGVSRKSMIGNLLERPVEGRLAGSLAAAVIALERGAWILRVHDVRETVDAMRVWQITREQGDF